MDDIVKQAMAKWPNVPHCYGWLGLDARGGWRMRDEATQQAGLPGDRLDNQKLVGFINRNYLHDERGNWYFQNGPQRVYVNLEVTPFIARTDPQQGLLLQTGQALTDVDQVYLTDAGAVLFVAGDIVAQFELAGAPASDDAVMAWLDGGDGTLTLPWHGKRFAVERVAGSEFAQRFGFNRMPAP